MVLHHEQLHFDIAELFARRLRKIYQEQITDIRSWNLNGERLYWQLIKEYEKYQDDYDRDIYADPSKQADWTTRVRNEMALLAQYAAN